MNTKKFKDRIPKLIYIEREEYDFINKTATETATDANTLIRGLIKNYQILTNVRATDKTNSTGRRSASKQRKPKPAKQRTQRDR